MSSSRDDEHSLLYYKFKNFLFKTNELLTALPRYYKNKTFAKADLSLKIAYLFNSPYTISKRFLQDRHESEIYAYGETPLKTLELIFNKIKISEKDHIFELGSGRGQASFWLKAFTPAEVTAIEYIPEFVERAKKIQNRLQISNLHFRQEDILQADLSKGTIFYLYGSSYEDSFLKAIADKLSELPAGIRIISISFPMSSYAKECSHFELTQCFPAEFPWGESMVYLVTKVK